MTGREIDALLAEKVFGCKPLKRGSLLSSGAIEFRCACNGSVVSEGGDLVPSPHGNPMTGFIGLYSSTGGWMLDIIEGMRKNGWEFGAGGVGEDYFAEFYGPLVGADTTQIHSSLPMAVALAALRALGVEVEGE